MGDSGVNNNSKKTMYFEFKFDGKAEENYAYRDIYKGSGIKDIMFQMSGTSENHTFLGRGESGFDNTWYFASEYGKRFDIPFYIGSEFLKKEYRSSDKTVSISPRIDFGIGIGGGIGSPIVIVYQTPFTAILEDYNENIHTNVAQFHVHFYQVEKPWYEGSDKMMYVFEYDVNFVGFKNK